MRPGDIDWRVMRGSIAVFVIAIAIGVGLVGGAVYFDREADRTFARQKGQLSSIRSRYQTVDEERRLIDTYLPAFERLEAHGIVGEELRLNWIESLREAATRHKIPSLRYEVDKQTPFSPGFDLSIGSFRLYGSRMELSLGLLHEEDLLRLMRDLERRAAGLYRVEECSLARAVETLAEQPKAQNVRARCVLRWLTLAKPAPEA